MLINEAKERLKKFGVPFDRLYRKGNVFNCRIHATSDHYKIDPETFRSLIKKAFPEAAVLAYERVRPRNKPSPRYVAVKFLVP